MTPDGKPRLEELDELPDDLFDSLAEAHKFGSNRPTLRRL
jgi:hypothetical protein